MPLSAAQLQSIARLQTFYDGNLPYDPTTNPGGFRRGGSVLNFDPALKDVAAAANGVGTLAQDVVTNLAQILSIAASQAPEYPLSTDLPASGASAATLAAYVTADTTPSSFGTRTGRWERASSTANWIQKSADTVPGLAARQARVEAGSAAAGAAKGFERGIDRLKWGWPHYDWNELGELTGGIGPDGLPRVWDGLGPSEANYRIIGAAATATTSAAAIEMPRLPLLGLSGASRGDAFEAAMLAYKLSANPPDVTATPFSACAPFAINDNVNAYGQYVSRGCFSGERFGGRIQQDLMACYGSNAVPAGTSGEGKGYVSVYRRVGGVLTPVLFLVPPNYPNGPSYCQNAHINRLPDGRALITCPVAGTPQKRMSVWAFILHNPETVGMPDGLGGTIPPDYGPPCFLGYGWAGVMSRSFGSDLLVSISTTANWDAESTGNRLYRLSLFGTRKDRIFSERIGQIPNAPQDVPVEQGIVRSDYYEFSLAALGRDGLIGNLRADTSAGYAGGQFWTRNFNRGHPDYWEIPFRAPFGPTTGSQAELTNDPDGDLVYAFNASGQRANAALAIQVGADVALAASWRSLVIDPRGSGAQAQLSYFRPFFPRDVLGRWLPNKPICIVGDRGRNKEADGADPNSPGNYIGNGVLYAINKADVLAGRLDSLTIQEFPTHMAA